MLGGSSEQDEEEERDGVLDLGKQKSEESSDCSEGFDIKGIETWDVRKSLRFTPQQKPLWPALSEKEGQPVVEITEEVNGQPFQITFMTHEQVM